MSLEPRSKHRKAVHGRLKSLIFKTSFATEVRQPASLYAILANIGDNAANSAPIHESPTILPEELVRQERHPVKHPSVALLPHKLRVVSSITESCSFEM